MINRNAVQVARVVSTIQYKDCVSKLIASAGSIVNTVPKFIIARCGSATRK